MPGIARNHLIFPVLSALTALVIALSDGTAVAGSVTLEGVTFTETSDNLRIDGVSGKGTLEQPFILREEILAPGDAIVEIQVHKNFGSRVQTFHQIGFALVKQVVNGTRAGWEYFNIELEKRLGVASDYYDGLSFGQAAQVNRPFRSDVFAKVDDVLEPRDSIRFSHGRVAPGMTVNFVLSITHTGLAPRFFLVQHVRQPAVSLPPRAAFARGAAPPVSIQ